MSDPNAPVPAEERLPVLLRDLSRMLRAAIDEALDPLGLSHAQWRPLLALHRENAPLTQTELARLLDIETPSVVRLLDRLSEKGYIERCTAPGDRRIRHVVLTDAARALVARIEPVIIGVRDQAFAAVGRDELATCCATLEKIREQLRPVADEG